MNHQNDKKYIQLDMFESKDNNDKIALLKIKNDSKTSDRNKPKAESPNVKKDQKNKKPAKFDYQSTDKAIKQFENPQDLDNPIVNAKLNLLPDKDLLNDLEKEEQISWANYLYSDTKIGSKKLSAKSHIIGLYDPFAKRKDFPAGRRWCVNVYTGCAFSCKYCYSISYIRDSFKPRVKTDFEKKLDKDINEIKELGLEAVPIHISNSTDPLQPLEKIHRHTLHLLKELHNHRELFTTITILTKNPSILCEPEYLEVIKTLTTDDKHIFQVEVTCPFYNDETRKIMEPGAPPVETRLNAIRELRKHDIKVALRIDPIFPRDPLPPEFFQKPSLKDYGAPVTQTKEDLEQLIKFAEETGCFRIIVSPLKLTKSRFNQAELIPAFKELYKAANVGKNEPITKGAAYRMPFPLYRLWLKEPKDFSKSLGIDFVYCKNNLIKTY